MSNTSRDPREPQGANDQPCAWQETSRESPNGQPYNGPDGQYAGQMPPRSSPNPESKFFQWIRESRLIRTNDRVIAGVCGGIARELGWDVTLVRVLMVVTAIFGGLGVALYALGWAFLPDELTGTIPMEELLEGRWDWSYIGIVLCLLICIFPGFLFGKVSVMGILLAALILFLLVNNGRRRFVNCQSAPNGAQPGYPAQPIPPMQAPTTQAPSANGPMPQPPTTPVHPQTVPAQPPMAVARQPRSRRPGAGAPLVLLVLGLVILSSAMLSIHYCFGNTISQAIQPTMVYVGIVTAILGIIVVVLGIRGHRTGGLHPFVWIAMATALALVAGGTSYSALSRLGVDLPSSYNVIDMNGPMTIGATQSDMDKLANGIYVNGENYDDDILTIDLSSYARHHGTHRVELNDGSVGTSDCPSGPVNLMARNAQVNILLPLGCSWSFVSGTEGNTYANTVGGRTSIYTRINPFASDGDDLSFMDMHWGLDLDGDHVSIMSSSTARGNTQVHVDTVHTRPIETEYDAGEYGDSDNEDNPEYSIATSKWFDDPAIERFCQGITTRDGKISVGSNANADAEQLLQDDKYWPCAVDADKAVEEPEILIAPNVLLGARVAVEYASTDIR